MADRAKDYTILHDKLQNIDVSAKNIYDFGYDKGYYDGMTEGYGIGSDDGLRNAWRIARMIACTANGGFSTDDLERIFGTYSPSTVFNNFSIKEAIEKIDKYVGEKQSHEDTDISVGDECHYLLRSNDMFVITHIYVDNDGEKFFDGIYRNGQVVEAGTLSLIKKTGRNISMDNLYNWMHMISFDKE